MRNPHIERLEAKLKLWDTPGFSQFIEDMAGQMFPPCDIKGATEGMKKLYQRQLKDLKEANSKQGKLGL